MIIFNLKTYVTALSSLNLKKKQAKQVGESTYFKSWAAYFKSRATNLKSWATYFKSRATYFFSWATNFKKKQGTKKRR
jgi:hypothetical protein